MPLADDAGLLRMYGWQSMAPCNIHILMYVYPCTFSEYRVSALFYSLFCKGSIARKVTQAHDARAWAQHKVLDTLENVQQIHCSPQHGMTHDVASDQMTGSSSEVKVAQQST